MFYTNRLCIALVCNICMNKYSTPYVDTPKEICYIHHYIGPFGNASHMYKYYDISYCYMTVKLGS